MQYVNHVHHPGTVRQQHAQLAMDVHHRSSGYESISCMINQGRRADLISCFELFTCRQVAAPWNS